MEARQIATRPILGEVWVLVPRKPTHQMILAANAVVPQVQAIYDAMIAAAAPPSVADGVPKGWVVVPVEPTPEMDEAAMLAQDGSIGGYEQGRWRAAWRAALARIGGAP